MARQLAAPGAFPRPAQQVLLYGAVITACDDLDGLRDGLVSNEPACTFDPVVLRCPEGQDAGDACLSDVQITAIRAISSAIDFPYELASGETGYPGFPYLSGARMSTPLLGLGTTAPANPMPKTAGYGMQFWDAWVKYAVTRDPSFDSLSLDPLAPGVWQERISELTALQDVNSTDLRHFTEEWREAAVGTRDGGRAGQPSGHGGVLGPARAGDGPAQGRRLRPLLPGPRREPRQRRRGLCGRLGLPDGTRPLGHGGRGAGESRRPGQQPRRHQNPAAVPLPGVPRYTGAGNPDFASSFDCSTG